MNATSLASTKPTSLLKRWRAPVYLPAWATWLLISVAAMAFVLTFSQQRELHRIERILAQQATTTQTTAVEAKTISQQAQIAAQDAETRSRLGEARINEYTLQRSHLEQLAFDLSRNRSGAMLIDIETSLRLAQQQAQLTGLPEPLLAALRNAQKRLNTLDDKNLSSVQHAIEQDITRLSDAIVIDTAGLLGRIDSMLQKVDQFALQTEFQPLKPQSQNFLLDDEDKTNTPTANQHFWTSLKNEFAGLVRVQKISNPEAVLLSSEQGFFLRENLRLQLMSARIAILAGQLNLARADLNHAQKLLLKYFNTQTRPLQNALKNLQQLQAHIQFVQLPNIQQTLLAINESQSNTPSAALHNNDIESTPLEPLSEKINATDNTEQARFDKFTPAPPNLLVDKKATQTHSTYHK